MATTSRVDAAVHDCVDRCARRDKWFRCVVAFARRLVRKDSLTDVEAGEVVYQARKTLKEQRGGED